MKPIPPTPTSPELWLPPSSDPEENIRAVRWLANLSLSEGKQPHEADAVDWLANFVLTPERRRYGFDGAPWLYEIIWAYETVRRLVIEKASQVRITTTVLSLAFRRLARGECSAGIGYFFPTDHDVQDLSKEKADPILQNSYLSELTRPGETQAKGRGTVYTKHIGNSRIFFRGAKSTVRIKSFSVDEVDIDEADEIPAEMQKMAEQRAHGSEKQRFRYFSKPSVPNYGIDASFRQSDQRYWTLTCRKCANEFTFEDSFPECVTKKEDRWVRCCPKCKAQVRLEDGRWVARNPSSETFGYHVSQMLSPTIDPGDLVKDFETTTRIGEFWRGRMGVAYVEESGRVTKDQVLYCCGQNPRMVATSLATAIGVDVGNPKYWVAGVHGPEGKPRIVGMGTEKTFDDIRRRSVELRSRSGVIDEYPETEKAMELVRSAYPKWWRCRYLTGKPEPERKTVNKEERDQKIEVHRTSALDALLELIRNKGIELPKRDQVVEEFAQQVENLVRIEEMSESTGEMKHRYIDTGPDHYAHAAVYMLAALGSYQGPVRSIVIPAR
jgi:Phage terminase large subunit (GpA)